MRKPNGAKILLPEWMTTAEAGAIQTVSSPRLSIIKLLELRAFLDRLMTQGCSTLYTDSLKQQGLTI